jgi:amino acid adenylation domain-containing protein
MNYSSTLHELFEMAVKKNPQKNAIIFNKQILSYEQLNQRANQVAHYLQKLGVKPDMPVVVCMERSIDLLVAMLGILKAGGAYIPLDHSHPEERLLLILKESTAPVVLTSNSLKKNFARYSGTVLLLDDQHMRQQDTQNPEPTARANNLAYIIYTSGSTGTPKGVLIEHKGVVNYAFWFAKECINGAEEKIDCSANPAFDFALTLTVVPLVLGLTVVICEEAVKKDPRRYIDYLQSNDISLIKITPSYFRVLFYEIQNKKKLLPRLKKIMLAGENLATVDCIHWLERYPQHTLYNEYGPTETSVAVTLYKIDRNNVQHLGETVPIGTILPNAQYHILNDAYAPVNQGESGELYLGGLCLARGYLNNPSLTDRYFIDDPFNKESGGKLYKTGDLCRALPSGDIECIGRIDHQLKIRGFRVELEEIEHCLSNHPAVKTAVVIASDKQALEKRLIAYYILNSNITKIEEQEVRAYLKRFLPDYMIPTLFVQMEQFPLNANEKLDRAALPVPEGLINPSYKAPKKPIEKKLAAIWSEALNLKKAVALKFKGNFDFFIAHKQQKTRSH